MDKPAFVRPSANLTSRKIIPARKEDTPDRLVNYRPYAFSGIILSTYSLKYPPICILCLYNTRTEENSYNRWHPI